jgi:hypothetical protein
MNDPYIESLKNEIKAMREVLATIALHTDEDVIRSFVDEALDDLPAPDQGTIEQLRDKLDEINETHQNVMAEKCPGDEHHCACVPFLRRGIRELQANLRQYENRIAAKDEVVAILRADIRKRAADAKTEREAAATATKHLRAIVGAVHNYEDIDDAIIQADRWLNELATREASE